MEILSDRCKKRARSCNPLSRMIGRLTAAEVRLSQGIPKWRRRRELSFPQQLGTPKFHFQSPLHLSQSKKSQIIYMRNLRSCLAPSPSHRCHRRPRPANSSPCWLLINLITPLLPHSKTPKSASSKISNRLSIQLMKIRIISRWNRIEHHHSTKRNLKNLLEIHPKEMIPLRQLHKV